MKYRGFTTDLVFCDKPDCDGHEVEVLETTGCSCCVRREEITIERLRNFREELWKMLAKVDSLLLEKGVAA